MKMEDLAGGSSWCIRFMKGNNRSVRDQVTANKDDPTDVWWPLTQPVKATDESTGTVKPISPWDSEMGLDGASRHAERKAEPFLSLSVNGCHQSWSRHCLLGSVLWKSLNVKVSLYSRVSHGAPQGSVGRTGPFPLGHAPSMTNQLLLSASINSEFFSAALWRLSHSHSRNNFSSTLLRKHLFNSRMAVLISRTDQGWQASDYLMSPVIMVETESFSCTWTGGWFHSRGPGAWRKDSAYNSSVKGPKSSSKCSKCILGLIWGCQHLQVWWSIISIAANMYSCCSLMSHRFVKLHDDATIWRANLMNMNKLRAA